MDRTSNIICNLKERMCPLKIGEPIFRHVQTIAQGNENTLLTLPKHLIKKLTTYLTFKDVLELSTMSHMAKEVFNGDIVWEVLYKRHKMGLVYRDEKEQGSSYGWKWLFKERQMHKPARNREMKKLSSNHHLVAARSSTTLTNRPSSSFPFKNQKRTTSATKQLGTETQTPKFIGSKNNPNHIRRPDTASTKKSNVEIKGCKLLTVKGEKGDDDSFAKTNTLKTISVRKVEAEKPEEPEKGSSLIFKSTTVRGTKEKSKRKGISRNITKTSSDQTSAVSTIGARKNSDQKSHVSVKKFSNLGQKSNPSSTRGNKSKVVSNTESIPRRCERKTFANSTKQPKDPKSNGKSVIHKTVKALLTKDHGVFSNEDFGLNELIRAGITAEYLNPDNSSPPDFWMDRNFESYSNARKESTRKCSKANSSISENKFTIYQKFSTPRKPGAETKSGALVATAESTMIPAKKFARIKAYLKCDRKNFCEDEPKLGNSTMKGKSSSVKIISDNTVAKFKSRAFLKTTSSASLDSKFI